MMITLNRATIVQTFFSCSLHFLSFSPSTGTSCGTAKTINNMFDRRVRYIRYLCNARFSAKDGLVKQIGVSNYNERHLGELLDYAEIRPMASQF